MREKITEIVGYHIIGYFIFDGKLNGNDYLAMLQNNVVPILVLYLDLANSQVLSYRIYGSSKLWLRHIADCLEWPARSPPLRPPLFGTYQKCAVQNKTKI